MIEQNTSSQPVTGMSAGPMLAMSRGSGRIAPLDGMRTIAIIGVTFMHIWSFGCDTPALWLPLLHVDINRLLSAFGTGVDLFFVISGFCMYLMYAGRYPEFHWRGFGRFLGSRFRRIAPTFYAAALVALIITRNEDGRSLLRDIATHLTFTYLNVPGASPLAAPFWSLATEWQFYLLLPPFVVAAKRWGFWRTLAVGAALSFLASALGPTGDLAEYLQWSKQIAPRFVQFAFGIALARLHRDGWQPPAIVRGAPGFALGVFVMYVGRLLHSRMVLDRVGAGAPWVGAVGLLTLTLGYTWMIAAAISSDSVVSRALTSRVMTTLGRWSYSFYLWHWFPSVWIGLWVHAHVTAGGFGPWIAMALSMAVVTPLAALSYRWFEAPYFQPRRQNSDVPHGAPAAARGGDSG